MYIHTLYIKPASYAHTPIHIHTQGPLSSLRRPMLTETHQGDDVGRVSLKEKRAEERDWREKKNKKEIPFLTTSFIPPPSSLSGGGSVLVPTLSV